MSRARKEIDPKALDIETIKVKRAITGVLIYEVSSKNRAVKADALAAALRGIIPPEEAKIARPHKMGDLRLHGLDEVTITTEVVEAVAKVRACAPTDIRTGQLKVVPSGMYTAWVQCPLAAANKIAREGKVSVE
jgi:hypothetical protein